jgi:alpha-L-rhamnosidase
MSRSSSSRSSSSEGSRNSAGSSPVGRFQLVVTVPPGTTAEVVLPDGTRHAQEPGLTTYECDVDVSR